MSIAVRKRRTLGRVLVAFTLSMCVHPAAQGQRLAQYTGTLERHTPQPATAALSLTIYARNDSTFRGYVYVAPPLGRSGDLNGWFRHDSIEITSISETGDEIHWNSARVGSHMRGTYVVTDGAGRGQAGTWSLDLAHGTALVALGDAPAESISSIRSDWYWWMLLAASLVGLSWIVARIWRRGDARPREWTIPLPDADARLRGVGGWMAWFLFAQILNVIFGIVRIRSVWWNFNGGSWRTGALVSGLRPLLGLEACMQIVALLLPLVAVVLTTRLDRRARPLWLLYLGILFAYTIVDMSVGATLPGAISIVSGADAAARFAERQQVPHEANLALCFASALWFGYWYRSKRVRVNFYPVAAELTSAPELAPT